MSQQSEDSQSYFNSPAFPFMSTRLRCFTVTTFRAALHLSGCFKQHLQSNFDRGDRAPLGKRVGDLKYTLDVVVILASWLMTQTVRYLLKGNIL